MLFSRESIYLQKAQSPKTSDCKSKSGPLWDPAWRSGLPAPREGRNPDGGPFKVKNWLFKELRHTGKWLGVYYATQKTRTRCNRLRHLGLHLFYKLGLILDIIPVISENQRWKATKKHLVKNCLFPNIELRVSHLLSFWTWWRKSEIHRKVYFKSKILVLKHRLDIYTLWHLDEKDCNWSVSTKMHEYWL